MIIVRFVKLIKVVQSKDIYILSFQLLIVIGPLCQTVNWSHVKGGKLAELTEPFLVHGSARRHLWRSGPGHGVRPAGVEGPALGCPEPRPNPAGLRPVAYRQEEGIHANAHLPPRPEEQDQGRLQGDRRRTRSDRQVVIYNVFCTYRSG